MGTENLAAARAGCLGAVLVAGQSGEVGRGKDRETQRERERERENFCSHNSDQLSGCTNVDLRSGRNQLLVVAMPAFICTWSRGVASRHLNACRTCFLSSSFRVWMAWNHDSRDEETGRNFS